MYRSLFITCLKLPIKKGFYQGFLLLELLIAMAIILTTSLGIMGGYKHLTNQMADYLSAQEAINIAQNVLDGYSYPNAQRYKISVDTKQVKIHGITYTQKKVNVAWQTSLKQEKTLFLQTGSLLV